MGTLIIYWCVVMVYVNNLLINKTCVIINKKYICIRNQQNGLLLWKIDNVVESSTTVNK